MKIVEETQELCSLCGGRGTESVYGQTAMTTRCRQCQGSRWIGSGLVLKLDHYREGRCRLLKKQRKSKGQIEADVRTGE